MLSQHLKREICEILIQVGHYAGWPALSNGTRQFTEILEEQKKIRKSGGKYKSKLL